jgi:hypothetical protein
MTQVIESKVVDSHMESQVSGWIQVALGTAEVLLGIVLAVNGLRRIPIPEVNTWARRHGVAIDNVIGPHVEHFLTRGRRIRTMCFLVPLVVEAVTRIVAGVYGVVRGRDWTLEGWVWNPGSIAILGLFGGAVLAELTWRPDRARAGESPAAMAIARDLSAYLPRWVTPWQRAVAAATVVLIPVIVLLGEPGARDLVGAVVNCLIAVAVTVVTELVRRHAVGRRQEVMAPEWIAVDDAMRSTSAHIVSGVGVLLVMLLLAGQLAQLVPTDAVDDPTAAGLVVDVLRQITRVVGIALWLQLMQPAWWPVRRFPVHA